MFSHLATYSQNLKGFSFIFLSFQVFTTIIFTISHQQNHRLPPLALHLILFIVNVIFIPLSYVIDVSISCNMSIKAFLYKLCMTRHLLYHCGVLSVLPPVVRASSVQWENIWKPSPTPLPSTAMVLDLFRVTNLKIRHTTPTSHSCYLSFLEICLRNNLHQGWEPLP